MHLLATELGIPNAIGHVEAGNVKSKSCVSPASVTWTLIVLGSRERHGLSILVNLTEDTVLHAAPCDVLAVRGPASEIARSAVQSATVETTNHKIR